MSIHVVSESLGVPAPTIRSWERRYGLPVSRRSAGRHRRYTPADITLVRRMRDEIAGGRPAAEAATVALASLRATPAVLVEAILAAAYALDSPGIEASLAQARLVLGLDETVDEVLLPAMREIGRQWAEGRCDVAHEHAATSTVQGWLAQVRAEAPAPDLPRPAVLACGPRDLHSVGLESLAALLTHRGVTCHVLGAQTPVESLVVAVRQADAAVAVVASHLASSRASAVAAIRAVQETPAVVYYAGEAFQSVRSRSGVPGRYLGHRLAAAADHVRAGIAAAPDVAGS